jgi:hypothetical protein
MANRWEGTAAEKPTAMATKTVARNAVNSV